MANSIKIILSFLLAAVVLTACKKDTPVDEDGLLITSRAECAVTGFELLGTDFVTVRSRVAVIDTAVQTINVEVLTGTNLRKVYPQFSLSTDCKLEPKITGALDLSDLANPKTFTVVSGNRQVRKEYKLLVKFQ
jgi:PBP1b-binding outer membrane lipoprotein LpoB